MRDDMANHRQDRRSAEVRAQGTMWLSLLDRPLVQLLERESVQDAAMLHSHEGESVRAQ